VEFRKAIKDGVQGDSPLGRKIMISEKFKTVFIHIPKCAGQSVETVFLSKTGLTWETRSPLLLRYNHDPRLGPERLAHLYAEEYVRLGYISLSDFNSYFKFSIVRNPWERLVSVYKYRFANTGLSFFEFVRFYFPKEGMSDYRRHLEPQWKFVCDANKSVIIDKLIRMENLQQEIESLFLKIFNERIVLPKINQSLNSTDYRRFYDDRTARFVEEFYKDDIKLFSYTFERELNC
jgi:Sulfotransferase family